MTSRYLKIVLVWLGAILIVATVPFGLYKVSKYTFRADRISLIYQDENNATHVVMIQLLSYEYFPKVYSHDYFVLEMAEDEYPYWDVHTFNTIKEDFRPNDFVTSIVRENNENTLNEDYAVSVRLRDSLLEVDLQDLTGDFLVNNALERFTYLNMGETRIHVNGKPYTAKFALSRKASIDLGQLQEDQKHALRGSVLFLTDSEGELFYTDVTDATVNNGKYNSHAWSLNRHGDVLQKDVGSQIELQSTSRSHILDLPKFDEAHFSLNKNDVVYLRSNYYNLLSGGVVDAEGERIIKGFSFEYDNR